MFAELEDEVDLENVLQQIFMDCDVSVTTSTPDLTNDAVPISRIIEYIQDELPNWSIDNLEELWKCLVAVSSNECVSLQQFKDATKRWITKVQEQVQSVQHDDNNGQDKLYLVNDTNSSMKTMDLTNDIVELELRNMKFRELTEENNILRDELERHEKSINNLKQQHSIIEKQLKHYVHKCQQFEKENDEQRDQLNELIKNEKTMTLALQRYTKEHQNLLKQLEAAEIEIQAIPSLKEKLEKITKEKTECLKLIVKMQKESDEKENNCCELKTTITELEDTSISMKKDYEYMIRNLREKNRKLTDENVELQSLSALNTCSIGERLSLSPVLDEDECYMHSTPYKSIKVPMEDSLYLELKASGFTADYSRSNIQELEDELNEYDATIITILEQLEKVIQFFVTIRGSIDDLSRFNPQDTDAKDHNIHILRHKTSFLLNMATEEITRRNTRQDSSTQLQVEPVNITSSLEQFGVRSFRDVLSTHAIECHEKIRCYVFLIRAIIVISRNTIQRLPPATRCKRRQSTAKKIDSPGECNQYAPDLLVARVVPREQHFGQPKVKVDLTSITHYVNNEDDDLFSRVIKICPGIQNRSHIIEPIIKELHDIIESTLNALVDRKDCRLTGNLRDRSIYTLSSNLQSLQSSSLAVEDSRQIFDYQNPETNTINIPFARGDGLTQEDHDEKSVLLTAEARDISKENPAHSEENRSSEMSKVSSILKVDSKALAISEEIKWNCASEQVPEVNSASNPASPRRKISVYCRPFDVVAVQDTREDHHQAANLEAKQLLSNPHKSPSQINKIVDLERNMMNYTFNGGYRNKESDSDSTNSSPGKQFQDSLLEDELPIEQTILRKIHLAPTRLRFPLEAKNELHRIAEASNGASSVLVNFTELDILDSSSSSIGEHKKDDDVSMHSSSTFTDKCKVKNVVFESTPCLNKNVSQTHLVPNRCLFSRDRTDPAKIVVSKDPHSLACVQRIDDESQSRMERLVDSQMSNREDSLAVSGNGECKPATGSSDLCSINEVANEVDKVVNIAPFGSLIDSVSTKVVSYKNAVQSDEKARERNLLETKREIPQLALNMKRSYSEGKNLDQLECHCTKNASLIPESSQQMTVFPNLTDICLQKTGITNLSDTELVIRENSSELELQKKYTSFSLCLCIDRLTLPRRTAISFRQRDQSEKNLSNEVQKMQQDIQELAPLCTDRESVERVERVRRQLDMIVRCAHRVSCAAETLGAVQQERRVSRAVLLADKYLQVLHSRCEKLITNVAETKRILTENNIVIEENVSELNDELPRIRYRSGTPANNRMMMARRRASVATMSRPMGSIQDVTKDTVRQRNSVSGRMILRRPSFSSESPKWDIEKLDRTESSNSISELRGIFEQAESRHSSREENNNMLRLNHSNGQSTINCAIIDNEVWTNVKEEISPEVSDNESINSESRSSAKSSQSFQLRGPKRRVLSVWYIMLSSILIFFFVFYMIHAMSLNVYQEPLNKQLIGYVFDKCGQIRNAAPHPI